MTDYQTHILDLLSERAIKANLTPVFKYEDGNSGALYIMHEHVVGIVLHFCFEDHRVQLCVNTGEARYLGRRRSNQFFWHFDQIEDMNEEVSRLFNGWQNLIDAAVEVLFTSNDPRDAEEKV